MNKELREVIAQHYEPDEDDENWYRCKRCGQKVHAREDDYSDLALHEVKDH